MGQPAPTKLPLLSDLDCLRRRGLTLVYSRLATRNVVDPRHRADSESDSAPVVLHVDLAPRQLASCLCLARIVGHALLLLFVLGRTAFCVALARRSLDAGIDYRPGARGADHARGCAKTRGSPSDLVAVRKSSGGGASNLFHSPVCGCSKPSLHACNICRANLFACFAP